jgi:chromosome segregation ATPase
VPDALNILKGNTTLFTVRLEGNAISTRKMKLLYDTLEKNKKLVKRDKIPTYSQEIIRLSAILSKSDEVEFETKEVIKECKEEKQIVDSDQKIFNRMKASQTRKSEAVLKEKDAVDNKMKRIDKQIEDITVTYNKKKEDYERQIKDLKETIRRMNGSINNLSAQGICKYNVIVKDSKHGIESSRLLSISKVNDMQRQLEAETNKLYIEYFTSLGV